MDMETISQTLALMSMSLMTTILLDKSRTRLHFSKLGTNIDIVEFLAISILKIARDSLINSI